MQEIGQSSMSEIESQHLGDSCRHPHDEVMQRLSNIFGNGYETFHGLG